MTRASTLESYQQRMVRALLHIQEHLDDALPLEELAEVACFSAFHFHRVFKGMVGESVKEHVRRLRLERAAQRLKRSDQPVTDIAFDAGYETHESFTRAFRAMFGMPPSEFRESNRPLESSSTPEARLRRPPGNPPLDAHIERLDGMRVAFLRHVGPYEAVGATWGRLMGWAWPRGLCGAQTRMLGICHDDPEITPPEKLRYDAAITLSSPVEPQGEIGIQELDAGAFAVALHKGPYDRLGETYARLCGEWLPPTRRELRNAAALEFYLNSPQIAAPADLLTRVSVPVES
jgi:AraC family transcriptional regulator